MDEVSGVGVGRDKGEGGGMAGAGVWWVRADKEKWERREGGL